MNTSRSQALYKEALGLIPGGVNSPVRAFRGVGGQPLFIERAEGPYIWDADGNRYIDYVLSWGPLALGHTHPAVVEAIREQAGKGTSYGAPTALESELARLVIDMVPSVEQVRFVNSGTEATMTALRLARAFSGRDKIVKFEGCYHGHADMLLVQAGSGVATLGLPDSPGVPSGATADTLVAPFNDLTAVSDLFDQFPDQIAAVIIEPVGGNMGVLPPDDGFLPELRELTARHGALLIFDEVMTGFRIALGGAQELYGVLPDLTTLGKVIGGGLPVGAYGGRAELMATVAPAGPMYQAGTLSGNPLAMVAGLATLRELRQPGIFEAMVEQSEKLGKGVAEAASKAGVPIWQNAVGSMFCTFFTGQPVNNAASARSADTVAFGRYFHAMLDNGVYLAPSQFEAGFMSAAHDDAVIEATIKASQQAMLAVEETNKAVDA